MGNKGPTLVVLSSVDIDEDTEIVHYGVKGMQWGVRRDRNRAQKARKQAEQATKAQEQLKSSGEKFISSVSGETYAKLAEKRRAKVAKINKELIDEYETEIGKLSKQAKELRSQGNTKKADALDRDVAAIRDIVKDIKQEGTGKAGQTFDRLSNLKKDNDRAALKEAEAGLGSLAKAAQAKASKYETRANDRQSKIDAIESTKPKNMSDAQLQSAVKRLQLERQLTKLQSNNPPAAINFARDVAMTSAKNLATQRVTAQMSKGLDVLISDYIRP